MAYIEEDLIYEDEDDCSPNYDYDSDYAQDSFFDNDD